MMINKACILLCCIIFFIGSVDVAAHSNDMPKTTIFELNNATNKNISAPHQLVTISPNQWKSIDSQLLAIKQGSNWFKLDIENRNFAPNNVYFTLKNSVDIQNIALYLNNVEGQLVKQSLTLTSNNLVYKHFVINANNKSTLYLNINVDNASNVAFAFVSSEMFQKKQAVELWILAFVVGGIVFTALVFGFLYIATNDKSLGFLSIFFLSRAILLSVLMGGNLLFLFPENSSLRGSEFPWLVSISSIFYIIFIAKLFNLKKVFSNGMTAIKIIIALLIIYVPLSLYFSVSTNILLSSVIMLTVMALLMSLGMYLYLQKQRLALMLFSIMTIQLIFTAFIVAGLYLDITLLNQRSDLHLISFLLNTLLIVLMMCRFAYYQLQDKEIAQNAALANAITSHETQEKLLQLQSDDQEELEQRVQERTLELNIALNELEILNQELEQKNTIDELTGLYNRRFYDQKILAEFRRSKRNLTPLSLLIADLDFFKKVNDTYGHLAGDQCLSWFAQHIKQSLKRSTDIGCRYGGEEFCLILPNTDEAGAIALAEKLRQTVEDFNFVFQEQHFSLTVSCGVSTYQQQDGVEPEHIFCAADKALYQAKRNGRNQVQTHKITRELLIQEH